MPPRWLIAAITAALLAGGCGSGGVSQQAATHSSSTSSRGAPPPPPGGAPRSIPAPAPTGTAADPASVKVIRGWSEALRRGDIAGAASYFALPSEMINGTDANGVVSAIAIHSLRQAALANVSLPCGAQFLSADQRGRYVNVLFRLTDRRGPGGGCGSGVGQTARTNFVIADGRIVEWIRAPLDPGDGGAPAPAPPNPQPQPQPQPQQSSPGSPVI